MTGNEAGNPSNKNDTIGKPGWLKVKLPAGKNYIQVKNIVKQHGLHTICESGNCPNIGECWPAGTATFMILGNICTRSCKFCAVNTGKPGPVDVAEPGRVAQSVKLMNLKHCVITSVTRDDLEDGGAGIWADTITGIKKINPGTTIEALIPDFKGNFNHLEKIAVAAPEVVSHNLETVRRLTPAVRSVAKYDSSLEVLKFLKSAGCTAKSGIMAGLGETDNEIFETIDDLARVGCSIITIGQYLQPTRGHLPVARFVTPAEFSRYKEYGLNAGIGIVESAPLVRSSYHAEKHLHQNDV